MNINKLKQERKIRRQGRVRAKISGTTQTPRLSVFRSNTGMYLQLIDDAKGVTILSAHSNEVKTPGKKTAVSFELGKLIAKKAAEKKIVTVVFDRGGNRYHGRIKMVAEGAREGGLKF